jgi:hypothetical protein
MPAIEAVARAQHNSALRGSPYAQRDVLARYDRAERGERRRRLADIAFWQTYIEVYRHAIADAIANKEPPPKALPHPDDIVIDFEKGVRFIGPVSEYDAGLLEENLKVRDVLLMQDGLDQRLGDADAKDILDRPGTALAFALHLNDCVPQHFRLCETAITLKMERVLPEGGL